jgi:hypothetical protein
MGYKRFGALEEQENYPLFMRRRRWGEGGQP